MFVDQESVISKELLIATEDTNFLLHKHDKIVSKQWRKNKITLKYFKVLFPK